MEAGGPPVGANASGSLSDRRNVTGRPAFLAEQRRLVTDRKDVLERRSGRRRQVDLPSGCRFVPSSENQGSQIRWIRGLPRRRWLRRLSVSVRTVRWRVRIHDHPSYQQEDWAIAQLEADRDFAGCLAACFRRRPARSSCPRAHTTLCAHGSDSTTRAPDDMRMRRRFSAVDQRGCGLAIIW